MTGSAEAHGDNAELNEGGVPACPHFGPCGGCQLQHLAYPEQLALKAERLLGLLGVANLRLPDLQVHPSPPLAYRNRIRLTLAEVGGKLRAGYLTTSSSDEDLPAPRDAKVPSFLPITQCPIAAPVLWQTAEAVLAHLQASRSLWMSDPKIVPDQLELFTTADESRLQFTLILRSASRKLPGKMAAGFDALCESVCASIPQLSGASLSILPAASSARSRRTEIPRTAASWGTAGLVYPIATPGASYLESVKCFVPRGTFFQVNRFLIPTLLSLVTTEQNGTLAFDLYAGVGLFSRALAQKFERVIAVEAAEAAAAALAATKLANLRAVKSTTLDFLRSAVVDRDRPELIVLDPPRTGAGAEVCGLIVRLAPAAIVYVSCSPERLAADLATLAAAGYSVSELHLLDLFPQTTHLETVVILTRNREMAAFAP